MYGKIRTEQRKWSVVQLIEVPKRCVADQLTEVVVVSRRRRSGLANLAGAGLSLYACLISPTNGFGSCFGSVVVVTGESYSHHWSAA